jgi:hypothetical protein
LDEQPLADLILDADPGLADFFLGRLASLVIRQMMAEDPDVQRALGRAVFSTFLDCIDLGLTDRADAILAYVRDTMDPDDVLAA